MSIWICPKCKVEFTYSPVSTGFRYCPKCGKNNKDFEKTSGKNPKK